MIKSKKKKLLRVLGTGLAFLIAGLAFMGYSVKMYLIKAAPRVDIFIGGLVIFIASILYLITNIIKIMKD